jgi:hypothetical protein
LTACRISENAPEISACDAITVAVPASSTSATVHGPRGTIAKKGFSVAVGSLSSSAPWPK